MSNTYSWGKELKKHQEAFINKCAEQHLIFLNETFEDASGKLTFEIIKVTKPDDLNDISDNAGFYLIFSDFSLSDNPCKLEIEIVNDKKLVKAIYRGQGSKMKTRLMSHLFNTTHKNVTAAPYLNCMQVIAGEKGIDVDSEAYKQFSWYVASFNMSGSRSIIRQTLENEFDKKYDRPLASREKLKVIKCRPC